MVRYAFISLYILLLATPCWAAQEYVQRPPAKGKPLWQVQVLVEYTDESSLTTSSAGWGRARGDGVERVTICNRPNLCTSNSGDGIYWLYWEWPESEAEGYWVMGGGTVGCPYGREGCLGKEVIVRRTANSHESRQPQSMPDLKHGEVKLGWWK